MSARVQLDFFRELGVAESPKVIPFDVCANRHQGNEQSKAANLRVEPFKVTLAERIRVFIAATDFHGATNKEIAKSFERPLHTITPRTSELLKDKQIWKAGRTRDNSEVLVSRTAWAKP